jgi:hypothetical protein
MRRAFSFNRTQDDLAIMIEGSDGQYYLQAGAVLLAGPFFPFSPSSFIASSLTLVCKHTAGTWRLEDKAGLPLDAIHTTGHVPHCTRRSSFLVPPAPIAPTRISRFACS